MSAHPQLCFDLAKLFEEHGTEAVLVVLRDACAIASHHATEIRKPGACAEHWDKAADALEFAMGDALAAEKASKGTLDIESALTVLSDMEVGT